MPLVKDIKECSTYAVHGLDRQILHYVRQRLPNGLARLDDIPNVILGSKAVHPWIQAPVRAAIVRAVSKRGATLTINSGCRTIAAQLMLRNQYQRGACGIKAAAPPGKSNHNNLLAIDVEDSEGWRQYFRAEGLKWIGSFDPMHYDYIGGGAVNMVEAQISGFQALWNIANPYDAIAVDGDLGAATLSRLNNAPAEGYNIPGIPLRILRLTNPRQTGEDVKALQLAIRKAGIRINYDGVYGPDTDRAIREFQTSKQLTADGILGDFTRKALGLEVGV